MAFNAKNLHYEKQEPEFLRKLRGEHGGDRQNVQFARPKKDRLNTGDDDDGPTIVDESGDVVERKDYEAMMDKGAGDVGKAGRGSSEDGIGVVENEQAAEDGEAKKQPEKQKVAEIGGARKRKAVKVVGDEVEDTDVADVEVNGKGPEGHSVDKLKSGKAKLVKKVKKVKLSFDEPEE